MACEKSKNNISKVLRFCDYAQIQTGRQLTDTLTFCEGKKIINIYDYIGNKSAKMLQKLCKQTYFENGNHNHIEVLIDYYLEGKITSDIFQKFEMNFEFWNTFYRESTSKIEKLEGKISKTKSQKKQEIYYSQIEQINELNQVILDKIYFIVFENDEIRDYIDFYKLVFDFMRESYKSDLGKFLSRNQLKLKKFKEYIEEKIIELMDPKNDTSNFWEKEIQDYSVLEDFGPVFSNYGAFAEMMKKHALRFERLKKYGNGDNISYFSKISQLN